MALFLEASLACVYRLALDLWADGWQWVGPQESLMSFRIKNSCSHIPRSNYLLEEPVPYIYCFNNAFVFCGAYENVQTFTVSVQFNHLEVSFVIIVAETDPKKVSEAGHSGSFL